MTLRLGKTRALLLTGAFGIAAASAFLACTPARNDSKSDPVRTVSTPASQRIGSHWVQDQRLRVVMAELSKRNPK